MIKKLLIVLALLLVPSFALGQVNLYQGGTGQSTSNTGDLLVGTSSTLRYSRLPVGTGVLLASSTSPFGMSWIATTSSALGLTQGTVKSVGLSVPTGLTVGGSPITTSGTFLLSLTSGFNIPLTASTTNWNNFFTTPSTQITAGTGLSWSGNTLNSTGGTVGSGTTGQIPYYASNGTTLTATSTLTISGNKVGIGMTPNDPLTVKQSAALTDAQDWYSSTGALMGRVIEGFAGQYGLETPNFYFSFANQTGFIQGNYRYQLGGAGTGFGIYNSAGSISNTSGEYDGVQLYDNGFAPTSGNGTYNALDLVSAPINQTGGASGTSRSIYITPSITSAADYRAIEIVPNVGYGIYQDGTSTKNYFAGKVGVGSSTPLSTLSVSGVAGTNPFTVASSTGSALFSIDSGGDIITGGGTPTISSCGLSPSVSGNDTSGTVTVGSGVTTSCTITFAKVRSSAPRVVGIVPNTAIAVGVSSKSTSAVTISFAATLGSGTFDYLIVQ